MRPNMSKKRQIFYRESTLRFNLRAPKSTRPTLVFLVAYINGKRYKISTKVKVYASQWNPEKQLAVISNVQSKLDNRNNRIANEHLTRLRGYFSEFIEYICNNNVDDIAETLKQFINRDMAKKKINLVYVAADALEYYHNYVKPSIKDSTKRQNESLLSEFGRFVETLREKDKTMQIFSQRGLNMYKEYLIDRMNKSKEDDSKRNFGVGQLNRCGSIIALLINKVLVPKEEAPNPVVWIKVEDPRREDQMGHIPLLDDEVTAIEDCSGLTPVEEEYRDVFLLHLECGQRVSDLAKILTGNYMVKQGKKYEYIVVSTTKENINAIIPLTSRMRMLMERIKNHKLVDPIEFEEKTKGKGNNTYNEAIRRIAKKAGLNRIIVKTNAVGNEEQNPLYKTISSHDARCTFITNMIKKGVSPERLCRMTGHANDEMIKRVYSQLTVEDEINRIESDLYSDFDEDGIPENAPQSTTITPKETTAVECIEASPFISDVPNYYRADQFDRDRYIKGLENVVETALTKAEVYNNCYPKIKLILQSDKKFYRKCMNRLKGCYPKTIDEARKYLQKFAKNNSIVPNRRLGTKYSNEENLDKGIWTYYSLRALIDNSNEKQVDKDVILFLERYLEKVYEKNRMVKLYHMILTKLNIVFPSIIILIPIIETLRYAWCSRPVTDHLSNIVGQDIILIRIPDWKLVHRELCKFSPLTIEAMIQQTNCPQDVKISIYESIVSGNVNLFANTIKSYDRETYEIIVLAYQVDFVDKVLELGNQIMGSDWETTEPDKATLQLLDLYSDQYPFNDSFQKLFFDIYSLKISDLGKLYLLFIDKCLGWIEELKERAYPLEMRIYNRLLELIDIYPELKDAYEEYKTTKKSLSKNELSDGSLSNTKPEVPFENLVIFGTESNFIDMKPKELLPSLNTGIVKRGDDVFKEFVNYLALSSCIDDDDDVKQLLVYRFTGKCRPQGELEKIPWNPDKLNELAYIIMYSTIRVSRKYKKVPEFFEGPKFPSDISMIRTYADSAPQDFRVKLSKLYPDVFTIKEHRRL